MTHLDPDPVLDNRVSYKTQDKERRSAPAPIVATRMEESEPLMLDHSPSSIPTYSTTPTPAPPIISPPPPRPTEFDYSKIPNPSGRKTGERAGAMAMKVWENRVKC